MTEAKRRRAFLVLASVLAVAAAMPLTAQSKKPAKKAAASPAATSAGSPPRVGVAVESVLDHRSTGDFPRPSLTVNLKLGGEDAGSVSAARARVTRAIDDTGKSLVRDPSAQSMMIGSDGWEHGREESPLAVRLELASPSRKSKTVTSLEGVLETYVPSRDPAATVKIAGILTKKDKPLTVPALASQRIRIQVLSKAGLEKEKKQAEERKKAEAAKKKKARKKPAEPGEAMESMAEGMGEAMGDMLGGLLERLFMTAGDNDLILKVDDPGKKLFAFDLAARDGKALTSYGTMEMENYRIVRMFEPIPEGASLLVRLKTAKSFGQTPFALSDLKLP